MPDFRTATVISHTTPAGKFHELTFETPEPLNFEPGQYVSVKVAPTRINSYSIAVKPADNRFSLLVDSSPGGPGSQYFEHLQVNDQIPYLGPFGKFTLNLTDGSNHLIFLGTGSGISPLRNMIDEALLKRDCQLPITLYFGMR